MIINFYDFSECRKSVCFYNFPRGIVMRKVHPPKEISVVRIKLTEFKNLHLNLNFDVLQKCHFTAIFMQVIKN